jgi:hypothetical protein
LRDGIPHLLLKILKQLSLILEEISFRFSPIWRENISPTFFDLGRKYLSNFLQFGEKISLQLSPITGENVSHIFSDFVRKYTLKGFFSHFSPFLKITPSCFYLFVPPL